MIIDNDLEGAQNTIITVRIVEIDHIEIALDSHLIEKGKDVIL